MRPRVALLALICGAAVVGGCSSRGSHRSRLPAAQATTAAATQALREAWPLDAENVWAWTSVEGFTGGERIVRSSDGGRTWTDATPAGLERLTSARQITSLFVLDADHAFLTDGGIAGTAQQELLSTADGGQHWMPASRTPAPYCYLDFVSPVIGWCVLDRATMGQDPIGLWATRDGGKTWQPVNLHHSLPVGYDKYLGFSTASLGWVVTNTPGGRPPIYRTLDGGQHWTEGSARSAGGRDGYGSGFTGLPRVSGRQAAVAFDLDEPQQSLIYRSNDGGTTWQPIRPPGPTSRWAVDIRTPESWVLIHGNQLLRTDDAGNTWMHITMDRHLTPETGGYYSYAPGVDFATPTTGWVVEFDPGKLWRTTSAGHLWTQVAIPGT
jgi:photosystem II stability/assembly factor-like uncharacterized protein